MLLVSTEAGVSPAARLALEALVVAALCTAFLWPFRLYGFDLVDEGTQLVQIERALAGERPYHDFETGYTPGYFALHARLLALGDGSIVGIRTFGVLWQAMTVGALWAILRAWAGTGIAVGVTLLYVAFALPVSLRSGAPFNVPYPGWISVAAALAAQALVARISAHPNRRPVLAVLACGIAGGVAFCVKPNAGLLVLAGSALALAPVWSPARRSDRLLATVLRASAGVATLLLLAPALSATYAIALLVPAVLAARRSGPSCEDGDSALRQLSLLSAGFAVVGLPWIVPLARELGVAGFLRHVLLLDGGVVEAYLLPFAAPGASTLVIALGGTAAFAARGRPRALPVIAAGTIALASIAAYPAGARLASENVLLWMGPIVLLIGLADAAALARRPRERAALIFLAIYSLQLFPRPDSIHVAMGGAPLALGAGLVWGQFLQAWREAPGETRLVRWVPAAALLVAVGLAVGRVAPAYVPRITEASVSAGLGPRVPVEVLSRHAEQYGWMSEIVGEIEQRSREDDPIFAFPDVAGLGFLAGRSQPFYYLYFVPGRPGKSGEETTLRRLQEVSPALVVVCPPQVEAFSDAVGYFSRLGDEFERAYAPAVERAGCVIRTRRAG